MNYLAINTSSKYLTVVARKGEQLVIEHLPDCAMQHSVLLMDAIDRAMKQADLTPNACDFFASVVGPGSFTGIRIGISTAKGLALGTGKPLVGVTAFDLVAYNTNEEHFYVVIDANHHHYYVCGYTKGEVTFAPTYLSEEEVLSLDAPLFGFEPLTLEGYTQCSEVEGFSTAVEAKSCTRGQDLGALYVRKSQAEEGRK